MAELELAETNAGAPDFGAFVISLDFERYWGVRDVLVEGDGYFANIGNENDVVRELLNVFAENDIAATWATVGFLFAGSFDELREFQPETAPGYSDRRLCPYSDEFVRDNPQAPYFFAPDLVDLIAATPRQEIASHTFSHFYCMETGQTRESFAGDLRSAVAIAERKKIKMRSMVFPRNQHNPDYNDVLVENGIICFRGNQSSWMYRFDGGIAHTGKVHRGARLADTFLDISGHNSTHWNDVWRDDIANVPASIFLRAVTKPSGFLEDLHFRRICRAMRFAAMNKRIFHLWWHPHNFGSNLAANILFLRRILDFYREMNSGFGMRSLSMIEVAEVARQAGGSR